MWLKWSQRGMEGPGLIRLGQHVIWVLLVFYSETNWRRNVKGYLSVGVVKEPRWKFTGEWILAKLCLKSFLPKYPSCQLWHGGVPSCILLCWFDSCMDVIGEGKPRGARVHLLLCLTPEMKMPNTTQCTARRYSIGRFKKSPSLNPQINALSAVNKWTMKPHKNAHRRS